MNGEFSLAVHAIVYLNHKAKTLSSEELAENICTNPARVRKVLAKLKKAGLVSTKEGIDGGYRFERNPAEVNLRQICEALDFQFVSASWRSGDTDMECLVASGMADVMDEIFAGLDRVCREKVESITIAQIDTHLFGEKRAGSRDSRDSGEGMEQD